jgi:hypothetical protein
VWARRCCALLGAAWCGERERGSGELAHVVIMGEV